MTATYFQLFNAITMQAQIKPHTPGQITRRDFQGFALGTLALTSLTLLGCAPNEAPPAIPAAKTPERPQPIIRSSLEQGSDAGAASSAARGAALSAIYAKVTTKMYGFIAGNVQSKHVVHVVFDPQCPHCGHLWLESQKLWTEVKFVWVPIPMMSADSMTNGALILADDNPVQAMNVHEYKLLNKLDPLAPVLMQVEKGRVAMQTNASQATAINMDAVPFTLYRRPSGEIVSTTGGIGAPEIITLIGR